MCLEVSLSDVQAAILEGKDSAATVALENDYLGSMTCPCGEPAEYGESYCRRCAKLFQAAYGGSHAATRRLEDLGHDL